MRLSGKLKVGSWTGRHANILDMRQWQKGVTLILSKELWVNTGQDGVDELLTKLVIAAEASDWTLRWYEPDHVYEMWIEVT